MKTFGSCSHILKHQSGGRYWPKAALYFHNIDQFGTSAFRPEAAIKLILTKGAANDPNRPVANALIQR
jgi:hypothetical protein